MKARPPEQKPGGLPAELAAGPFVAPWFDGSHREAQRAWVAAGQAWSTEHGLGPFGWRDLLPDGVAYWAKASRSCPRPQSRRTGPRSQRSPTAAERGITPNQGDIIMSNAQINTLAKVIASAEPGGYTLPPELLESWNTFERVRGLTLADPESLPVDVAAALVVAAVASGKTPDVLEIGREMHRLENDRQAHGHAGRVLAEAREQAGNTAVSIASDLTERIIADHLKPALEAVYAGARECAAALHGYGLDTRKLLDAPPKARAAYNALGSLVVRRDLIFGPLLDQLRRRSAAATRPRDDVRRVQVPGAVDAVVESAGCGRLAGPWRCQSRGPRRTVVVGRDGPACAGGGAVVADGRRAGRALVGDVRRQGRAVCAVAP